MTTITRNKNKRTPARSSLVILHMLLPMLVFAQSTNQNYIHSKTFLDEGGISCIEEIAYFNGIGQPVQTVKKGITPSRKDLVILKEYDQLGRDSVSWLPIPVSNNNGAYRTVSTVKNDAVRTSIYNGDTKPCSTMEYDSSPLGRVIRETGAGQAWYDNGKCVSTEYYANDEGAFSCRRFNVSGNSHVVTLAGLWPPGALTATKTSDEDGRIQVVFRDFLGRAVLKRSVYENGNNDTYFIYDQRGNLQAVLPPAAVRLIENNAAAEEVSKYAYFYEYDIRGNCISKKLPGADPVKYRYDRSGRVVFSQDGNLRAEGKWHFYLYDSFERLVVHGITRMNTPPDMGNQTVCAQYGSGTDTFGGYSANLNLSNVSLLSVNYYDNYSFLDNERNAFREFVANGNPSHGEAPANANGMLTGSRTYIFSNTTSNATAGYHATAMYYDEKGRLVRSCSENQFGGYDETRTQYTFTGMPQKETNYHTVQGKPTVTTEYNHTYDHAGRLLTTTHSLNGETPVTLAEKYYDEVGRLQSTRRANNSLLTTQYRYNVRSWLTAIATPEYFIQTLDYNQSQNGSSPQWGGNISAMEWRAMKTEYTAYFPRPVTMLRRQYYTFEYDGLSRLTRADHGNFRLDRSNYDTEYTYDNMGNILTLKRYGQHDDGIFGLIDDLTFEYDGNQITKVTDAVDDGPYRKDAWHYRDGSDRPIEREYDGNGNLIKDSDAKISSIEYNCLNLPRMIKFSDSSKHVYTYDASGRKLRAEYHTPVATAAEPQVPTGDTQGLHEDDMIAREWDLSWEEFEATVGEELASGDDGETTGDNDCKEFIPWDDDFWWDDHIWDEGENSNITSTDYCGNFIYENGELSRVLFPDGHITFLCNDMECPDYNFYLTDHQGNVRVVVDLILAIDYNYEEEMQFNNYYPYGGLMGESTNSDAQPYKYNGKELDRHSGLDWYDYGARWYNGVSWMTPDPLAEKYYDVSPYVYCHSNPINRIDPNGMDDFFTTNGEFIRSDNLKSSNIYIVTPQGAVMLSEYDFSRNMRAMMYITHHYARKVGLTSQAKRVGIHNKEERGKTLAYTTEDNRVRVMTYSGHFDKDLNQVYNFESTLSHEKFHIETPNSVVEEVSVIMKEMRRKDFEKTTPSFKKHTNGYLQKELEKLYEKNQNKFYDVIEDAQHLLEKYGANSQFEYIDGGNRISF